MNPIPRLLRAALLAVIPALAFDYFILNLPERPFTDQVFLIVFSTAALRFLLFEISESGFPQFKRIQIDRAGIVSFLRENAPGILLAILFLAIYTHLGLRLNHPNIETVDNFLDADNSSWMKRLAMPNGSQMEMRGPHPFAFFIFRPLGWILNLFTRNPYLSAVLLNTLTGGLCVFLAWIFIKRQFQSRAYAFLVAAMLGLSTSHLFFGSVIESYIFSAAALIGFIILLQNHEGPMGALAAAGLLTFGITLTNFIQNFIGFAVSRPRWRDIVRFGGLVVSFGILLGMAHAAWYPSANLFFLPSGAQAENEFAFLIFQSPTWKIIGRVTLLIRTILLYTVIAPQPFARTTEVGGVFPRFNFYTFSPDGFNFSSYSGLGNLLVLVWAAPLLIAGVIFLWNLVRTRKADLSLAFVLCILFNFVLHLNYGYEPFLYSLDWAYALIFFIAFGFAPFAKNRWFQAGLAVFLILLAYNQWQFFQFILETISPFFG